MATTVKKAAVKQPAEWREVGQRFETLGTDLRRHFVKIGKDAATQRAALEKAIEALVKDIEKLFVAAGDTLRDPVLRKDIAKAGEAVRKALHDTVQGDAHHADHVQAHVAHAAKKPATVGKRATHKPTTRPTAKPKHPA